LLSPAGLRNTSLCDGHQGLAGKLRAKSGTAKQPDIKSKGEQIKQKMQMKTMQYKTPDPSEIRK